jgi:AAA domain
LLQLCTDTAARVYSSAADPDDFFQNIAEETGRLAKHNIQSRPKLKVWNVAELMKYEFPPHLALVGDNEITMGYDGLTIIAGPGSSGKSLAALSLAVAGATGESHWQGRKIHRRFKTLIIQAENGARRLREDLEGYLKSNPADAQAIAEGVFLSEPPEGGLCFNHPEFRAAVRRKIEELKPDLVILDPWQSIAAEDAAKDVVEMLNLIRSCYPSGDACPGTIIVAHTNKPRADVVRTGRNLVYNISGSVALVNTARCVYVLLPWSAELEDHRVYWACVKLNNGVMYAPTVWLRRKGGPFLHDSHTDPTEFGKSEEDNRQAITEDQLRACFDGKVELSKKEIATALVKNYRHSQSTAYRAIDEDGYLRRYLMRAGNGKLKLQAPR